MYVKLLLYITQGISTPLRRTLIDHTPSVRGAAEGSCPSFASVNPAPPCKGTPAGALCGSLAQFTPLVPFQVSEARQGMLRNSLFSLEEDMLELQAS
jgi:hypothetical protein